jgi:hypothetical protein
MPSHGQFFILICNELLKEQYEIETALYSREISIDSPAYFSDPISKPGYYNLHITIDSLFIGAGSNFAIGGNGDFGFMQYFENTVLSNDP